MVAAPWRQTGSSGSTSAGRRSSPELVARDGTVGRTIEVADADGRAQEAFLAELDVASSRSCSRTVPRRSGSASR